MKGGEENKNTVIKKKLCYGEATLKENKVAREPGRGRHEWDKMSKLHKGKLTFNKNTLSLSVQRIMRTTQTISTEAKFTCRLSHILP